jgi:uncharacterized protein YacL
MTETGLALAIKALARRFAVPALAAWLLHIGVWILLFAIEQQMMVLLTQTVGWFVDHLLADLGSVEKTYSPIQFFAENIAEGVVLILLGLFIGSRVARRKRQSLSQFGWDCQK